MADGLKIGIMGGTFNPIHNAHLILAQEVLSKLKLDKVIFIPSGNPPHKNSSEIAEKEHRYNMTKLAIEGNDSFEVSKIEIDRSGMSYTYDTINELLNQYNNQVQLFFIIGADAIYDIESWYCFEKVLRKCNFVVATRPGMDSEKLKIKIKKLIEQYNGKIQLLQLTEISISSTEIREKVKKHGKLETLLPEKVETYIYENNLYATEK